MVKFLDLQRQITSIRPQIDEAIRSVVDDATFIGGAHVKTFERVFAAYQGASNCIGVANGTDALEIAIEALSLPPGSEIVVPANSFIASTEAVTRSGHRVVFCDCDPETYTISIEDLKTRVTDRTSAVIAVHLYGHACDMDALREIALPRRIRIIEDAAQAHGAEYKGKRVGTHGDISAFSFYPGKNLGAFGDAGAILTNDDDLATRARMIANHGRIAKYDHAFEGRNSRLDTLQAAILTAKLPHLDAWNDRRIAAARAYDAALEGEPSITLPKRRHWAKHVYHLYVIRTAARDALREHLASAGVETGIHYPVALPKLQAYSHMKQDGDSFFANQIDRELLSLPMGDHMDVEAVDTVVAAIVDFTAR